MIRGSIIKIGQLAKFTILLMLISILRRLFYRMIPTHTQMNRSLKYSHTKVVHPLWFTFYFAGNKCCCEQPY
jgi:hypothetical protein